MGLVPSRCLIAGVINMTPDSFSGGGELPSVESALNDARAMVAGGADWIDVGGESTRPRSVPVPADEEQRRVVPLITRLRAELPSSIRISIDTYKASTARAALGAGASVVNDVSGGLLEPPILDVVAEAGAAVVLGHMRGRPAAMQDEVSFADVVSEVVTELRGRIEAARASGCRELWADPGIGFGKTLEHNLALLRAVPLLVRELGVPIMIGVSRKRFIGDLTGRADPRQRLHGTSGAVAAAVLGGASAVRVHDVAAMTDVVRVAAAIRGEPPGPA